MAETRGMATGAGNPVGRESLGWRLNASAFVAMAAVALASYLVFGLGGLIYLAPLAVAFALEALFPRVARVFFGFGLMFMTFVAVLFLAPQVVGGLWYFRSLGGGTAGAGWLVLAIAALVLTIWADVEFVFYERARKRARS